MQFLNRSSRWLLAGAAALVLAQAANAIDKGDVAPPFKGVNFAGQPVEFPAVVAGKPAVVIFWATWCSYCKAFMPYLKRIESDYAAHGVKVVAINAKEDSRGGGGDPRAYFSAIGFSPVAVANGDAIAATYGIQYIPGLLIVDGKGMVAYRRPWTDLPAGQTVAELWDGQVRGALDALLGR
jgi:thiol-disulfide isomerase/thioredoxin